MRKAKVLSISIPAEMLQTAEQMAKEENRTMSELVREALRVYQRERRAWQDVFAYGEKNAKELGIKTEQDVVRIVREARSARRESAPAKSRTRTL